MAIQILNWKRTKPFAFYARYVGINGMVYPWKETHVEVSRSRIPFTLRSRMNGISPLKVAVKPLFLQRFEKISARCRVAAKYA